MKVLLILIVLLMIMTWVFLGKLGVFKKVGEMVIKIKDLFKEENENE